MNALTTLKDMLHLTDTSFDTVPNGYTTTDADVAARGFDNLLDRLAGNINDQSSAAPVRARHFAASPLSTVDVETVERTGRHFKSADLSDLPSLTFTLGQA